MMASYEEREWEWKGKRYTLQPGQILTSLASLAEESGDYISVQNVRTALKRFEKYGFLTNESTMKNRLITLTNWELYQGNGDVSANGLTTYQQTAHKELTTTKESKKEKKVRINNFLRKRQVTEFTLDLTKGESW
jgi:DNA replication protein DnaD